MTRLIIAFFIFFASPGWAAKHAFIVGNSDYRALGALQNTVHDAEAYAKAFEGMGYQIDFHTNLGLSALADAFEVFLSKVAPGDQVTFVFSGHGWSDGATNYLIPTDAPSGGSDFSLRRASYALSDGRDGFLDRIKATGAGLSLAIIDACRNNPFTPDASKKSASMTRGLSRVEATQGSFVIFSAGEGQEALDRLPNDAAGTLSVFTRNFLPRLTAGIYLEDAISEAQVATAQMARGYRGHQQHPAYYDQTLGKTCLTGNCARTTAAVAPLSQCDALYREAKAERACYAYQAYLDICPQHVFSRLASGYLKSQCAPAEVAVAKPKAETKPAPFVKKTQAPKVEETAQYRRMTLFHPQGATPWAEDTIALSTDGRRLATAGADSEIWIWDTKTGKRQMVLKGHEGPLTKLRLSSDAGTLVSINSKGILLLWRLSDTSGKIIARKVADPKFTPMFDNKRRQMMYASLSGELVVVETKNGTGMRSISASKVGPSAASAVLSPKGDRLAVVSHDGAVRVLSYPSGLTLTQQSSDQPRFYQPAFSPSGKYLALKTRDGVQVWAPGRGLLTWSVLKQDAFGYAFRPDKDVLEVLFDNGTVRSLDLARSKVLGYANLDPADRREMLASNDSFLVYGSTKGGTNRLLFQSKAKPKYRVDLPISPKGSVFFALSQRNTVFAVSYEDGTIELSEVFE